MEVDSGFVLHPRRQSSQIAAVVIVLAASATTNCGPFDSSPASRAPRPAPSNDEISRIASLGIRRPSGTRKAETVLVPDVRLVRDLDGDGHEEAIALVDASGGGSELHLVIAGWKNGVPASLATAFVGDRVQLRKARVGPDGLTLDLVQAGPDDPLCCPGNLVTRTWRLMPAGLLEQPSAAPASRLSLQAIAASRWVLHSWDVAEPAAAGPEVSFRYQDGRLAGSAGCTDFTAFATESAVSGSLSLRPVAGARKACSESFRKTESRFLARLSAVKSFGFLNGRLMLGYEEHGRQGAMLFSEATR